MALLDDLKALGANTDEGLKRFMNHAPLYEKMILKFVESAQGLEVMPFLEAGDTETALTNAHTLKGVTGNLSLTPLFTAYDEIVTQLRAGNPEQAKQRMAETVPVQQEFLACISKYL